MRTCLSLGAALLVLTVARPAAAGEPQWKNLLGDNLDAWKQPVGTWVHADSVAIDRDNAKKLVAMPGKGIWVNGPTGKTRDLVTKESFGDVELHVEFMIPKGSNSGVKLHGHYEIQILDSFGAKTLSGDSCGGIYPRAELKPKYHHIDKGVAPLVNACKPAGEWQTLDIIFVAPRFDAAGKKVANARFVKVVLNGKVVHDNVELLTPTGHMWTRPEVATGPILLQADHGPVAFRNVRVRPYVAEKK
jgi:hypothetical protein